MKKKTLVPLIIFFVGICLVGFIAYQADSRSKEQRRITAQLNAEAYGERIKNEITNGIAITDTLQQVLISQNGNLTTLTLLQTILFLIPLKVCSLLQMAL